MKRKSTEDLLQILLKEKNIHHFIQENSEEFERTSLAEEFSQLFSKYQYKKSEIIRLSNLDKSYAYQIFDGRKCFPSRNKLLALCIAMQISLKETEKLLNLAHCPKLYPRNVRDSIIINAINTCTNLQDLNFLLFDMDLEMLE